MWKISRCEVYHLPNYAQLCHTRCTFSTHFGVNGTEIKSLISHDCTKIFIWNCHRWFILVEYIIANQQFSIHNDVIFSKWRVKKQSNIFVEFGALYWPKTTFSIKSDQLSTKGLSFVLPNIKTEFKKLLAIKSYSS